MWWSFSESLGPDARWPLRKHVSVTKSARIPGGPGRSLPRPTRLQVAAFPLIAFPTFFKQVLSPVSKRVVLVSFLLSLWLIPKAVRGDGGSQVATWSPSSPDSGEWNTDANWSPAAVPNGTAIFGASNTTTITFSNSASVGALKFNPGAPTYSFNLSSSLLTITGTGIVNLSSNSPTFSTIGNLDRLNFHGGSTAGNATVTNNPVGITNFFDTSTAGTATITNNGGITRFINASTAGNATIINNNGGTGRLSVIRTAGTATITKNAATQGGETQFLNTSTAGTATITTNEEGVTTFSNLSTGDQARFITNAGGIFDISFLTSVGMTAGSIEGAGAYRLGSKALTVGLNNLSTEVSGTIIDGGFGGGAGGALIKVGAGTLTLTGPNTYSGGTSFGGGILAANGDANLGTGPLSFDGGTLQALAAGGGVTSGKVISLDAGGGTFLADVGTISTLSGAIGGIGLFNKDGPGTLILTGNNTYSGGTTINEGILRIGNGGTSGSIVGNVIDKGTIAFNRSDDVTLSGNVSGTGTLSQKGSGTLTLTGANTYSGGTSINGGNLQIGNGGTTGSIVGDVVDNGTLAFNRSDDVTFSGNVSGTGILSQEGSGTLTLNVLNTYSGGTKLNRGILAVNSDANLGTGPLSFSGGTLQALTAGGGITSSKAITINGGGGTFLADAGTTSSLSGAINGLGVLTKDGLGKLILTGANTYSGGTVLKAGILTVHAAQALGLGNVVVNGGTLNADPQSINVRGNYTQTAGGTLQLQVAGANPGQYDSLNVGGNARLGGTLQLLSLGFQPKAGNQLTVVTTGGVVSGQFAQVLNPFTAGPGFNTVEVVYEPNSVLLAFLNLAGPVAPVLPGSPIIPISIALSEVSPGDLTAIYDIGFSNANIQRLNVEDRLDAIRAGYTGFSSNMNLNGATTNPGESGRGRKILSRRSGTDLPAGT